jgi:hypothetical protein
MPERLSTRSWAVRHALACRNPFITYGNFHAVSGGGLETGRLPEPYRTRYREAWRRGDIAYTVYSYRTPIAWQHVDGTTVTPPVWYSPTTSRHQGLLYALGQAAAGPLQLAVHRERRRDFDQTEPTRHPGTTAAASAA